MTHRADAILFDKDGTLFEFGATWNAWGRAALQSLSGGDEALLARLADAIRFDLGRDGFTADSPVVAGTAAETADCLAVHLPGRSAAEIEYELSRSADNAPLVEAVPLAALMAQLNGMGLKLGVMTNDSEQSARSHLGRSGVHDAFRHIIGFDSGHGAKPAPGPLLAFAAAVDISPERIVMVGDSPHDLEAGRAAGMQTVAVLTGPIGIERLAPIADSVLPDIGHLPDWIVTAP